MKKLLIAITLVAISVSAIQVARLETKVSVNLAWDASPSPEVTNYKIYWGPTASSYTNCATFGNVTTATVTGLLPGTKYFFAATAATATGLESDYSNEVGYITPALPSPPARIRIPSAEFNRL